MRTEITLQQIIDINLNRFKYVAKYVLFMCCFMVVLTTIISIFMFFTVVGLRWMNAVIGVVVILGFVFLYVSKILRILRKEIKGKPKQKDNLQQYLHIEEKVVVTSDHSPILRKILDELPKEQQEVLFLKYYENLTTEEIAQILGITPANVKQRRYRAMKKLREMVKDKYPEFEVEMRFNGKEDVEFT